LNQREKITVQRRHACAVDVAISEQNDRKNGRKSFPTEKRSNNGKRLTENDAVSTLNCKRRISARW